MLVSGSMISDHDGQLVSVACNTNIDARDSKVCRFGIFSNYFSLDFCIQEMMNCC